MSMRTRQILRCRERCKHEDGWAGFLEKAVQYDIYCMFVAAFTPHVPLEHYLKDAQKRGEIKLDGMMLLWRPGDRR